MKFLAVLVALAALSACASPRPVPSAPVAVTPAPAAVPPMIEQPDVEPLPAGVTPLTVEQDEQIARG